MADLLQIASANRAALRPVAGSGGEDQPVPDNFTGILPPANGANLIVDANARVAGGSGFTQTLNDVYSRDGKGAFSSIVGSTRTFEPAYCARVQMDVLVGYGLDGLIQMKITRQRDGVVVYQQNGSCTGPDNNTYAAAPYFQGPGDVYTIQVIHISGATVAFDGLLFNR